MYVTCICRKLISKESYNNSQHLHLPVENLIEFSVVFILILLFTLL